MRRFSLRQFLLKPGGRVPSVRDLGSARVCVASHEGGRAAAREAKPSAARGDQRVLDREIIPTVRCMRIRIGEFSDRTPV